MPTTSSPTLLLVQVGVYVNARCALLQWSFGYNFFLTSSLYPWSPNLCQEAVVDCVVFMLHYPSVGGVSIVNNPDVLSKRWKEDRRLVITWLYSMC